MQEFRSYLQSEFNRRKENNPAYSIRAFARFLDIDQSTLSKFFKADRQFNVVTMNHCLNRLKAPEAVQTQLNTVHDTLRGDYQRLEEVMLEMMSSWKYWAVLEYLKINDSHDVGRMAEYFHFNIRETEELLEKLVFLGFIRQIENKYQLLKPNNKWSDKSRTSEARKQLQKNLTSLSLDAIDKFTVEDRYHGSLTVAIPRKKLPEIKERISLFQEELGHFIQKDGGLEDVYQLTVSFFPLSEKDHA